MNKKVPNKTNHPWGVICERNFGAVCKLRHV